jgi:hypothetical protein
MRWHALKNWHESSPVELYRKNFIYLWTLNFLGNRLLPLQARDSTHAEQIRAGTVGRLKGHRFEKQLTEWLNAFSVSEDLSQGQRSHIVTGHPAIELVRYICQTEKISGIKGMKAWWLGGLATAREGDLVKGDWQEPVRKSKSDVVLEITIQNGKSFKRGISVKTCDKKTPTNDQLFLSTAVGFCDLLRSHGISVSPKAKEALRMFCGDNGFRPLDLLMKGDLEKRRANPERFFWEEMRTDGRKQWEKILAENQKLITAILLQKAYPGDPFEPEYLMHQMVRYSDVNKCPLAIFKIDELVDFSSMYAGFRKKEYRVPKGRYKNDPNTHEAPRFGFVQFQRFGNVQNAMELQFNLKAGYFYLIPDLEKRKRSPDIGDYLGSS